MKQKRWQLIKNSVVYRMVLIIIIAVLPINILTIAMSNYSIDMLKRQIATETEHALMIYIQQIEQIMKSFEEYMNTQADTTKNQDFAFVLKKQLDPDNPQDEIDYRRAFVRLANDYEKARTLYSQMDGVVVWFSERDDGPIVKMEGNYSTGMPDYMLETFKSFDQKNVDKYKLVQMDNSYYLTFIRQKQTAYYGGWINLDNLLKTWELTPTESALYFFTDENKTISSRHYDWGEALNIDTKSTTINGIDYVPVYAKSEVGNFYLVNFFQYQKIIDDLPVIIRVLQVVSIAALIVIPIILAFLYRYVIRPVGELTKAMQNIESGNMDYRITEEKSSSEFEQINTNFNHMMDQIKRLKFDVYDSQIDKQKIKMQYLSQQIQPHFILNTLNILYSYEPEEYPLIQKMIQCLAKYFRYIVKINAEYVEIGQELEHIRNYFEIQMLRYPETFYAIVECEEGLEDCLIPPLIIQNFAENAIKYALNMGEKIDIYVVVQNYAEQKLRIRIADTGEGIGEDILTQIEAFKKTKLRQPDLGIGIQNAIERLELLFKHETETLFYNSKDGHGATIELIIPQVRNREDM